MTRIVIDPGHGGTNDHGKSTAYGARGPGGTLEKHVTLEVARQVVARLGGDATLTRNANRNLSLKERAAQASGADVFVSLHADRGGRDRLGPETWVHPAAGAGSRALAASVQQALVGGPRLGAPEPLAADLAVINPAVIGARTDACLVELDDLPDPGGERRLRDAGHRARLGAAIADAIRQHVGRGGAYGDGQSFDRRYVVPLIPQPTGMSCWAASAAMLVSWREQMSRVDAADIARGAGQWAAYAAGLNPARVGDLATAWQLTAEAPQSYTVDGLRDLLERMGPLWIGEAVPGLHAVVLAGISGDGTPDGTTVSIVDPWPVGVGATYSWPFRRFVQAYEAAASRPAVNIQVLHNGGAGPVGRFGGRRLGRAASRALDASAFDDVADLDYDRRKDTRAVSTKAAAKAVVARLRAWSGASPWQHLNQATVCARLDELIDDPQRFQQGATPLCGPASFYSVWTLRDPVAFAEHAASLFMTGRAAIGASYGVTPGRSLLARDYGAVRAVANGLPPQADWMLMGAIRNTEDDVFVWDGSETGDTVSGITFPSEIERWLNATGLYAQVDNRIGTGLAPLSSKGFNAALALTPTNGTDIICLVQSNPFVNMGSGRTPWYAAGFPSHYVVLTGPVIHNTARSSPDGSPMRITVVNNGPDQSVSLPCWCYGRERPDCYAPSMSEFASNYYGAIVARLR